MLAISVTRPLNSSHWMKVLAKSMYGHREHRNTTNGSLSTIPFFEVVCMAARVTETVICVDVMARRSVRKSMRLSDSKFSGMD